MRSARRVVAVAALLFALAHASAAWAGGWVLPVSGGTPTLGFGVAYPGGTHRGVDLEAAAGSEVVAPTGGTVTFAGRVPADGGGTCGAVTIELADGHRVSLLPLEGVCVATGDVVSAGDTLASLAAVGDGSSAMPHLHVGLRSGDLYLDPTPFLPRGGASDCDPVLESAPVTVPDPPPATSECAVPAAPVTTTAVAAAAAVQAPASTGIVAAEIVQPAVVPDAAAEVTVSSAITKPNAVVADTPAPNNAPRTVRAGGHALSFSARPVTSAVLALGMLATGIAIIRVRRAAPVHAR